MLLSDYRIYLSGSLLLTRHLYVTEESRRTRGQLSDDEFQLRYDMAKRTDKWNHFANHLDLAKSPSWENYAKKISGSLSVDSGGFQISMGKKNTEDIDINEIMDRYEYYGLSEGKDFGFSLDRPIGDFDSREFIRYYDYNVGNILKMKERLGNVLIPVIHSCNESHVEKVLKDIGEFPVYSMPSRFGTTVNIYERHMQSITKRVKKIKELMGDVKIFLLGGGGLKHSIISFVQGAHWTDASSWIRSANTAGDVYGFDTKSYKVEGRIIRKNAIGSEKLTKQKAKILYDEFTVYDNYLLDVFDLNEWYETLTSFGFYRACHNAWAMKILEDKINELGTIEEISSYYASVWKKEGTSKMWVKLLTMCLDIQRMKQGSFINLL